MNWKDFVASENVYVFEKATENGRKYIAVEALKAENAIEAKQLSRKIYTQTNWEGGSQSVMKEILLAKVNQNPEVKEALLKSGDKLIAEAVPYDYIWSTGLSKEVAATTNPKTWPGKNLSGKLWMDCTCCGELETTKHMLFECNRVNILWCNNARSLHCQIRWKILYVAFHYQRILIRYVFIIS